MKTRKVAVKFYSINLIFTDPYIGSRNGGDRTISEGLTLEEAQNELLTKYNEIYSDERDYVSNWGLAVRQSFKHCFGAEKTRNDGTRYFTWDGRKYEIVEEK